MSYWPRAMELGARLLGLIFRKLSKLEAWSLALGPRCLTLAACTLMCLVLEAWDLGFLVHGPGFSV